MGTFCVGCTIENTRYPRRTAHVGKLLVDTGSECTWIPAEILKRIGIVPIKKDVVFQMANGQEITRNVGFAVIRVGKLITIDEVVFAQEGDLQILGARTLEGLNVRVDSARKKLVAAGPLPVAAHAIRSHPPTL